VTRAPHASRLTPASLLTIAYVGGAMSMWGTLADTAWHRTNARDSFWSAPHMFMYVGGLIVWAATVAAVVLATRGRLPDAGGPVLHAGRLRLPFGFALSALGVGVVVAAAPFDIWFHAVFGKDVMIWSPPHTTGHVGGMIAASGLLFAAAAQRGRGVFRDARLWMLAVLLPAVHFIHIAHYVLSHYVMTPATRTPDFYPLLIAIMFPAVLVALARAAGPLAPVFASLLFLAALATVNLGLWLTGFARYTLTPVVAVPALAIAAIYFLARRAAARVWTAIAAGVAFTLIMVGVETWWMAAAVAHPWPASAVLRALPTTLLAGALSGLGGWIWGGFLLAPRIEGGAAGIFGGRGRARVAAVTAVALFAVALVSVYRPQVFGPPMTTAEFALEPSSSFPVQEAVFWEAVLDEDWGHAPRLEVHSEGVIDGIPLPIGPAWCAADAATLAREVAALRFGMEVNGVALDLARYPTVPQRLRDGRHCAWVGVVSRAQRASRNRIVYSVAPADGAPATLRPIQVEMTVVFKDP
jgi:hypothetical protein